MGLVDIGFALAGDAEATKKAEEEAAAAEAAAKQVTCMMRCTYVVPSGEVACLDIVEVECKHHPCRRGKKLKQQQRHKPRCGTPAKPTLGMAILLL